MRCKELSSCHALSHFGLNLLKGWHAARKQISNLTGKVLILPLYYGTVRIFYRYWKGIAEKSKCVSPTQP
jgi:hypothetical protein